MDGFQGVRESHGFWRRLVKVIRRYPRVGQVVQRAYRRLQPRFTIGVIGVLVHEDRVLLVEHLFHPYTPWGLPGGWIGRRENPAQTVEREFLEETGLRVRAVRPLIVQQPKLWRGHMDVVYLMEPAGPVEPIRLCHELLGYRWTPRDDLPKLVPIHAQAIRAAFEERQLWTTDD